MKAFDESVDVNADGAINVLDVALLRRNRYGQAPTRISSASPGTTRSTNGTEQIVPQEPATFATPGGTASLLFLIRSNTTPLLGYSLAIEVVPQGNATGSVTADLVATNFFDSRNLITAGGATRDPFFSVITDNGKGGVFINTITDDDSTVLASDGVNDVLAQVFLDASADACGIWSIRLGQGSALSDANASPVSFSWTPGTFVVTGTAHCSIPAVTHWGLVVMGLSIMAAGTIAVSSRLPGAPSRNAS
jgi:hypothetical protein